MPLWCFQNLFIRDIGVLGVHCTLPHVLLVSTRKQNQYYFFLSESEEAHGGHLAGQGFFHTEILQIGIRILYSLNKIRTSFEGNIFNIVYLLHGIVQKSPVILTKFGSLKDISQFSCSFTSHSETPWTARRISRNT